ncbi:MAG TPA: glycosyltransferase family 2 protein [Candidatus Micrarchaeaceae archaeon]|nr:glycosyltransferase family 2 protein [Candidatus Micrarchaeaceae archaeon]
MPAHNGEGESMRGASMGLGGALVLLAAAVAVMVLNLFEPLARYGVATVLALAGLILLASQVLWLRKREDRGQLLWTALLNGILVVAVVVAIAPLIALASGFVDLVQQSKTVSGVDWLGYGFAFTGLFLGAVFFAYAVKYYLSTVIVLLTTIAFGRNGGNGNGNGNGKPRAGLKNGYHIDLGYHPFVSVHVAAYNERRVIERLMVALSQLEYPEYEVIVVDDSTDDSKQILERWVNVPRFKILHRNSRAGYKGGALREALKVMDPRSEYVVIFDADSVPFPDALDRFLPHFYYENGNAKGGQGNGQPTEDSDEKGQVRHVYKRRENVAAVQSYQWHVLNKSESWLTEAVRAEYAGSYMVERPFQDAVGSLKMVAGTAYMIRADLLREIGWGTSITEDWELTLKLYARGYKVAYTPWAETPAECVSTFSRLARQRMRWAEGHTYNVRRYFFPILLSPFVSFLEKVEFLFDTTYYLQAALFVVGTLAWLLSEVFFHTHVPGWTATLGWALLFSNILALPLMNLGGLLLEEAPARDLQGVLGAVVLSFALVPFQGWAAFKGLLSKEEGPWFRTPKTGRITDEVHHLRRLHLLRRWLLGHRAAVGEGAERSPVGPSTARMSARPASLSPTHRPFGWVVVGALALALGMLLWGSTGVPVVESAANSLYLHGAGVSPACTPSTLDRTTGARATPCSVSSNGTTSVFSFIPSPSAQTITGTWSFLFYWTGGTGSTRDTISISAGILTGGVCVASIPSGAATWTTTFGNHGANTTSPVTVNTSASQTLVIPAGATLCLIVSTSHGTGGATSLLYDGVAGVADTQLITPSIVVPESVLGFVGLALAIPLITGRRRLLSFLRVRA